MLAKTLTVQTWWALLAAAVIFLAAGIASLLAFPFGGGEYHYVFAYSDGGRVDAALHVFAVYVVSAGITTWALVTVRFPVRWWMALLIAVVLTQLRWAGFVEFPGQSAEFHRVALTLLLAAPLPVVLISLPAVLPIYRRPKDWRPSVNSRRLAHLVLALPYLGIAISVGFLLVLALLE